MAEKPASKVEALDFVISVLKEHEKRLDKLANQLETIAASLTRSAPPIERRPETTVAERTWPSLQVANWREFRARSQGAKTVAFQAIEGVLTVSAWVQGMVHMYTERVPQGRVSFECGYESQLSGSVEAEGLREWLARELSVKPAKIVEGFLV